MSRAMGGHGSAVSRARPWHDLFSTGSAGAISFVRLLVRGRPLNRRCTDELVRRAFDGGHTERSACSPGLRPERKRSSRCADHTDLEAGTNDAARGERPAHPRARVGRGRVQCPGGRGCRRRRDVDRPQSRLRHRRDHRLAQRPGASGSRSRRDGEDRHADRDGCRVHRQQADHVGRLGPVGRRTPGRLPTWCAASADPRAARSRGRRRRHRAAPGPRWRVPSCGGEVADQAHVPVGDDVGGAVDRGGSAAPGARRRPRPRRSPRRR